MPSATTIVKSLMTGIVLPGTFMTLMGLGVVPVDEKMSSMAAPFLDPFGIPVKQFFLLLGPCKILGGLSLWGIGPMPEWFARIGLIVSSVCGGYGHYFIGDSVVAPVVYLGMIGSLYFLDPNLKGKKE